MFWFNVDKAVALWGHCLNRGICLWFSCFWNGQVRENHVKRPRTNLSNPLCSDQRTDVESNAMTTEMLFHWRWRSCTTTFRSWDEVNAFVLELHFCVACFSDATTLSIAKDKTNVECRRSLQEEVHISETKNSHLFYAKWQNNQRIRSSFMKHHPLTEQCSRLRPRSSFKDNCRLRLLSESTNEVWISSKRKRVFTFRTFSVTALSIGNFPLHLWQGSAPFRIKSWTTAPQFPLEFITAKHNGVIPL